MNTPTPVPMDDYGVVTAPDTVRIERLLPGPIERVWAYLTESDKRGQWFAAGALEPRVGGRIELQFRHATLSEHDDPPPPKYADMRDGARMEGRVTEFDPPRVFAYTWGESAMADSHVRFELSPQGDRVRLCVVHSRLGSREQMLSVSAGWHTHLDILRDRLSGRAPQGFWRVHTRLEGEYGERIPG